MKLTHHLISVSNCMQTFEGVAGYRELQTPRRQILVELAVQLLIEAHQLCIILGLRRLMAPRRGHRIPRNRHVIVDPVYGIVLDRRVEDLQSAPLEAVESALLGGAPLEQSRELTFGNHEIA